MTGKYESWGRYPKYEPSDVIKLNWRHEIPRLDEYKKSVLPYGLGKSYGDSCLNHKNILIDAAGLNKIIDFNPETGTIRVEAGVSLSTILDFILPRGYFLATTPGTKLITVGGAIGNDVHGKNHHKMGTFGCHVTKFELLRSDGQRLICSETENPELFRATIGGLGLTGLITWAEFKNQPCPTEFFAMQAIKYDTLDDFFSITEESEDFDYTVSWVDTTASGADLGRGIFNRGNHADPAVHDIPKLPPKKESNFPFEGPFINPVSVHLFNVMYYHKQLRRVEDMVVHYDPFFYPLDAVHNWNKAYGKNGFMQYQFVIPFDNGKEVIKDLLTRISRSGMSSFLTVLKTFGDRPSPGMLSFPRPGITMAIDFKNDGEKTLKHLLELDQVVKEAGGILYPAKDARMRGEDFRSFYPQWEEFSKYIDPKFSSSFWRRVTQD